MYDLIILICHIYIRNVYYTHMEQKKANKIAL